jgi:hypothetical protein
MQACTQYRHTADCGNAPYEGKVYYHDRLYGDIACKPFFANSDNNEQSSVSTPTHGGDVFGKELTRDHRFGSSGLNLAFEGLLLGATLRLQVKATSSNPCTLGPRVCNASTQCEGGSAMFCRKSEMPEVARRRPMQASIKNAFGGAKTENTSRRCHTMF